MYPECPNDPVHALMVGYDCTCQSHPCYLCLHRAGTVRLDSHNKVNTAVPSSSHVTGTGWISLGISITHKINTGVTSGWGASMCVHIIQTNKIITAAKKNSLILSALRSKQFLSSSTIILWMETLPHTEASYAKVQYCIYHSFTKGVFISKIVPTEE